MIFDLLRAELTLVYVSKLPAALLRPNSAASQPPRLR